MALTARILPRLPARVEAGAGIAATLSSGVLRVALSYDNISSDTPADTDFIALQAAAGGAFKGMTYGAFKAPIIAETSGLAAEAVATANAASTTATGAATVAAQALSVCVRTDAAQSFTDAQKVQALANLGGAMRIKAYTAQATTSGSTIEFTDIPDWTRIIKVVFNGVSLSATDDILIQLGTASAYEFASYTATRIVAGGTNEVYSTTSTAGFLAAGGSAANVYSGLIDITTLGGNIWAECGNVSLPNYVVQSAGGKSLSGVLTRLRLIRAGASATFDAGSASVICLG